MKVDRRGFLKAAGVGVAGLGVVGVMGMRGSAGPGGERRPGRSAQ